MRPWGAGAGALALACLASGCSFAAQRTVREGGVVYGEMTVPMRGRWWQHYERGLILAGGGAWMPAERDLRTALRQRDRERRRVRTVGMRFTQYFVHRELAAVLIGQGRLEEAEAELRRSLDEEPSAKAALLLAGLLAQRAGRPPPAVGQQVIRIAAQTYAPEPPPGTEDEPGAVALAVIAPAAGAATVHLAGRCPDGSTDLDVVGADGSRSPVALAADRSFAIDIRSDATLATRGPAPTPTPAALAAPASAPAPSPAAPATASPPADTPAPLPGLTATAPATAPADDGALTIGHWSAVAGDALAIDGPPSSHPLPSPTAWFRVDAASPAGLRTLDIEDGTRTAAHQALEGIRFVGMVPLTLAAGHHTVRFRVGLGDGRELRREQDLEIRPAARHDPRLRAQAQILPATWSGIGAPPARADDAYCEEAMVREGRFNFLAPAEIQDQIRQETSAWRAGFFSARTLSRVVDPHARYVITFIITRARTGIECYASLIHKDSGAVFAHLDGYTAQTDDAGCRRLFTAIANRLGCDFPVLVGTCIADQGRAVLDLGARDGVRDGVRFSLVREDDAQHTVLATLEAGTPEERRCIAKLLSGTLAATPTACSE